MSMNFIVPQVDAKELAKALHEACRGVTSNFTEWDNTAADIQKVFMTQATTMLKTYCVTVQQDIVDLDESLDCARRDCIDALQRLRKCHSAFVAVLGVETDKELSEMKESLLILTSDPDKLSDQPAKVAAAGLITMIDTLTETGYRHDGTCTGNANKCCGACGDKGVRGVPEKAQWGPL